MTGYRKEWADRFYYQDQWNNGSRYRDLDQNQQQYGFDNSAYRNTYQDRSRSRNVNYGINSFEGEKDFFVRNRNRNRRSSSAPRVTGDNRNKWNQKQNIDIDRNRAGDFNAMNREKRGWNNSETDKRKNQQPAAPEVKRFRHIFDLENKTNNDSISDDPKATLQYPVVPKQDLKDEESKAFKEPCSIPKKISATPYKLDPKYCGESIIELNNKDTNLFGVMLPVIDWPKDSFNVNNMPEYSPNRCVGGDGIFVEVFYTCKYCQMFTSGSQIEDHLKSSYHYNKYKEFLKTGKVVQTSSSSSTTSSSGSVMSSPFQKLKTDFRSPSPTNVLPMDIDDPAEIIRKCHQELDFD